MNTLLTKKKFGVFLKISLLGLIVAQIIAQPAYAACSVDTSSQLVAAGETCTGSLLSYVSTGIQQRAISTSGANANLTLLDGTSASGLSVRTITVGGTNAVLSTGSLTIVNEYPGGEYWVGIDIEAGNNVYVNGELNVTRMNPIGNYGYAVNLNNNSGLHVVGDVDFNNIGGGDGVHLSSGSKAVFDGDVRIYIGHGVYSGVSGDGGSVDFNSNVDIHSMVGYAVFGRELGGTLTFNGSTNLRASGSSNGVVNIGLGSVGVFNGETYITSDSGNSLRVRDAGSRLYFKNIVNLVGSGAASYVIDQLGGELIIDSLSGSSAGYFANMNGGNLYVGAGVFSANKDLFRLLGDSSTLNDINLSGFSLESAAGEGVLVTQSSKNNVNVSSSFFRSEGALVKTSAGSSGTTDLNFSSSVVSSGSELFADARLGSGVVNLTLNDTDVVGTAAVGGSALNFLLNTSSWQLKDSVSNQASFTTLGLNSGSAIVLSNMGSAYAFSLTGDVANAGTINLVENSAVGDQLVVNGGYVGNDGSLLLNLKLDGTNSVADFLKVNGAASGRTAVRFSNINALSAPADAGVKVVETDSSSAQAFYLPGGYLSDGLYEYTLAMRSENTQDNWYLLGATLPSGFSGTSNVYSPNSASMIGLQRASNLVFSHQLEDREGASISSLSSSENYRLWLRSYGSRNKYNSQFDQLSTTGRSWITQFGVEFPQSIGEGQLNLGLMAGYASYTGNSHSRVTQRKSSGQLDGYSVGAYTTWFQSLTEKTGYYVDTWLLWNHFDNDLVLSDSSKHDFKSSGITASIETGLQIKLMQNETLSWWIQPQAQIEYQGVKAKKYEDSFGVKVESGKANVQSRVGAKTYIDITASDKGLAKYRPYLELNWLHNSNPHSVELNKQNYQAQDSRNLGEVKLGLEASFSEQSMLWANASYVSGGRGNREVQGEIGLQYKF